MNDETELLAEYVKRVEWCLDDIDDSREKLKTVLAEAAGAGLNAKALRKIANIRRKDVALRTRGEIDDLVVYGRMLGFELITS